MAKIFNVAQKRLKRDFCGFCKRDSKVTTKETIAEIVTAQETPRRLKRDTTETQKRLRDSKVTTKETLAEIVTTQETPKRLKRDSKETPR